MRRREGDRKRNISTHALREEGDAWCAGRRGSGGISTHALREEGDNISVLGSFP